VDDKTESLADGLVGLLFKGADENVIHSLRDRLNGVLKGQSTADGLIALACVTGGCIAKMSASDHAVYFEVSRQMTRHFMDGVLSRKDQPNG